MADHALHRRIERLRRHREELQCALEHGLSIEAARERLASYAVHRPRLEADPVPAGDEHAHGAGRRPAWWQDQ